MLTCKDCGREGSRGFVALGDGFQQCANTEQCEKRRAKAERAKLADRCVDCVESGEDPKGTRKLALKDDGTRQPGPRCVTHWRARKRDISSQAHAQRLSSNFELTPDQYWALYAAQGNKCFVCRKSTGKARRLAVDHDHLLAVEHGHDPKQGCILCIRALLCKRCNTLIGWLDVEALQRAIIVLTDPPARKILCIGEGEAILPNNGAELATAIPPTLESVETDPAMRDELIAALDEAVIDGGPIDEQGRPIPAWIEELADEDGIPQSDVGVVEFFAAVPVAVENFWSYEA